MKKILFDGIGKRKGPAAEIDRPGTGLEIDRGSLLESSDDLDMNIMISEYNRDLEGLLDSIDDYRKDLDRVKKSI